MIVITKNQTVENGENRIAEASELGIAPGQWPDMITMLEGGTHRGGTVFIRGEKNGDGYNYTSVMGKTLVVLND